MEKATGLDGIVKANVIAMLRADHAGVNDFFKQSHALANASALVPATSIGASTFNIERRNAVHRSVKKI